VKAQARFEIQRRLGAGGFGVVFEAFDRDRQMVVALKELARNDPAALYRFKREFRTLADLAHPNLVTLYELISDEDQWLLAMELVRGVDFLDYVQDVQPFGDVSGFTSTPSSENAATVAVADTFAATSAPRTHQVRPRFREDLLRSGLRQLAEGVRHLHLHDILHRDIKPSNVLVSENGRVVLLDFGLATELTSSESPEAQRILGTPEYMSPEQAAGEPLTEASDWYSVGVVLYQALTGRRPFSGSFLSMLLEKHQREATPPRELAADLPEDLDRLCCDLLRRDASARPSGADIAERLAGGSEITSARSARSHRQTARPFVGRTGQLAAMRDAYQRSRSGKAVTLYVRGTSGMGKTALVRQFLQTVRSEDRDAVVLAGRCYEQEAVPYKALDGIVDALAEYLRALPRAQAESLMPRGMSALARVFPVLQRVEAVAATPRPAVQIRDSHELRRRASAALRELLGRTAERHPVVLFIDDLQWGDADSASLLIDLLRSPDQPALLLIANYRGEDVETNEALRALLALQTDEVRTIDVGELSPPEAGELAHLLLAREGVSDERAASIVRESGGHPFFIDQLVRYGEPEAADTNLDSVLLGRVARLPPPARALLEVTAVAGRPIDVAVANTAAELLPGDFAVVAALRAKQLVRTRITDVREIEPYHDRVRETIAASLSPDARAATHRRLAHALEASGRADPEALAVHFRAAGDPDHAARYALVAADQAAGALAFERAARLYRLAIELQPGDRAGRHGVWVKLGDALANGGRVIEAAQAYLTAAEGAAAADRPELERQAAEQFLMGGYLDEGLTRLRAVLAASGLPLPTTPGRALLGMLLRRPYMLLRGTAFRERAEHAVPPYELWRVDLCHSAVRSLGFTETIFAIELQMRHLLLALKVGEPYRAARALGFEAIADARDSNSRPRAYRLLQRQRELHNRIPPQHVPDATANVHVTAGMLAYLAGSWKTAGAELQQAEQLFREQSAVPYKLVVVQVYTLSALYYSGQFPEFFRRIPEWLKESLDRGNAFAEASLRLQNAQRICFRDDDPRAADDQLREARNRWSPRGFLQIHASEMFHRADFALYRGDARLAWDTISGGWPRLERSHLLRLQTLRIMARYVRARTALAMAASAGAATGGTFIDAAEKDARAIEREHINWGTPLAYLVQSCAAARRGDRVRARELLTQAEAGFDAADMAIHASVARMARGTIAGGDEGGALAAAARQWMAGQGVKNPSRLGAMHAPGLAG